MLGKIPNIRTRYNYLPNAGIPSGKNKAEANPIGGRELARTSGIIDPTGIWYDPSSKKISSSQEDMTFGQYMQALFNQGYSNYGKT